MSYRHIQNLYREQTILLFRECYAAEKIHGTSAHVSYKTFGKGAELSFSSGGEKHARFVDLFDLTGLLDRFAARGHPDVKVFGEAYGGKQQGQSWRYGPALKFVAFEVQVGTLWLAPPQAEDVVRKLGLEFVHCVRVSTDLAVLDAERDAPSVQAKRNGVAGDQPREGVVLRPLVELTFNNGERIIAKHKRDDERETRTPRPVVDLARQHVLSEASAIADEWVTPTRLAHVLDHLGGGDIGIERTGDVVRAMVEDVLREGAGEIVDSKEARSAIGRKAALLFRELVTTVNAPVVSGL
jgi:hypothetical protein